MLIKLPETFKSGIQSTGRYSDPISKQRAFPVDQNILGRSTLSRRQGTQYSNVKGNSKRKTAKQFSEKQKDLQKLNKRLSNSPMDNSNSMREWDASHPVITSSGNQTKEDRAKLDASIFNQIVNNRPILDIKYTTEK